MKNIFFIISIVAISCCSSQKITDSTSDKNNTDNNVPSCVNDMIAKFKKEEVQSPQRSVYRYTYNRKTVYYVPPVCCDFFSDLYDDKCNLIGHPDGGFTGRGDGTAADFIQTRTNEKLIWKDERK